MTVAPEQVLVLHWSVTSQRSEEPVSVQAFCCSDVLVGVALRGMGIDVPMLKAATVPSISTGTVYNLSTNSRHQRAPI